MRFAPNFDGRPEVSVLMPAFNAERYVRQAIESILTEQRIQIQLVLVDDRSTDLTESIARDFQCRDSRVTLIKRVQDPTDHNPRQGKWFWPSAGHDALAEALNLGLTHCAGKYIARLDADDLCINDRLFEQWNYMERNPEVSFLGASALRIDETGRTFGHFHCEELDHRSIVARLSQFAPYAPHSSWFVRRQVFEMLDGYDEQVFGAEDLDLMLRAARRSDIRFAFMARPLIKLRMHPGSLTNNGFTKPVTYAISAVVRDRLADVSLECVRCSTPSWSAILTATREQLVASRLERSLAAYDAVRFAYIAFRSRRYLTGIIGVFRAFLLSPTIAFDYRLIRRRKLQIADAVFSSFVARDQRAENAT